MLQLQPGTNLEKKTNVVPCAAVKAVMRTGNDDHNHSLCRAHAATYRDDRDSPPIAFAHSRVGLLTISIFASHNLGHEIRSDGADALPMGSGCGKGKPHHKRGLCWDHAGCIFLGLAVRCQGPQDRLLRDCHVLVHVWHPLCSGSKLSGDSTQKSLDKIQPSARACLCFPEAGRTLTVHVTKRKNNQDNLDYKNSKIKE